MNKELFQRLIDSMESFNKPDPIPFIISTKGKEICVRELGLEGFKNEVRMFGFTVVHVVDNIVGPIKERIEL